MEIGWPFSLLNGIYVDKNNIPYNYLLINYLYKLPEFVLFLYIIHSLFYLLIEIF